jgi:hypothetical protein
MPRPNVLLLGVALCLAPIHLFAEDQEETPCRFGLRAIAAAPRQDYRDLARGTGKGLGVFAEQDQGGGWSCLARIDFVTFGESGVRPGDAADALLPRGTRTVTSNLVSIGAEARWKVPGLPSLMLTGGAFGARAEFRTTGPTGLVDANGVPVPGTVTDKDRTSFKFGLSGGVGFAFGQHLALTVTYRSLNLTGVTLATLEGGLEYRF